MTTITINLGKELSYYTNKITNVFTTYDYSGVLISLYKDHVANYYNQDKSNMFSLVHMYKTVISDKNFVSKPCDTPLSDIENAKGSLKHIIDNRHAYDHVIGILMKDCRNTNHAGNLIYDLLSVLKTSSKDFHNTSLKYDRYMGLSFSVADVINTVYAYGSITGLVQYYNLQEGKDG